MWWYDFMPFTDNNFGPGDQMVRRRKKENQESSQDPRSIPEFLHNLYQGYHSIMVLPFILHLGFMTFTAFFVMHVQVRHLFLALLCLFESYTSSFFVFCCEWAVSMSFHWSVSSLIDFHVHARLFNFMCWYNPYNLHSCSCSWLICKHAINSYRQNIIWQHGTKFNLDMQTI